MLRGATGGLYEAYYCVAGLAHGFLRRWKMSGEKQAIEEYRFGVKVRRRVWRGGSPVDGSGETLPPQADGRYPAEIEAHFERNRLMILASGGDPDEVPALFAALQPGEWDDQPTPGDAARWEGMGG